MVPGTSVALSDARGTTLLWVGVGLKPVAREQVTRWIYRTGSDKYVVNGIILVERWELFM